MTRLFCPDYGALPDLGGYRPMYTLYKGEPLKVIVFKDGVRRYTSFQAAREAAKEWVAAHLNTIRADVPPEPDDPLHVEEWRQRKAEEAERERIATFGAGGPTTIFAKGGRQVVVERRRRG
jgi:hypothetical protein